MNTKLTKEQQDQQDQIEKINTMSHVEMARLWRFGNINHKYFDNSLPYHIHFAKRFAELGGMTPEISKYIGWK